MKKEIIEKINNNFEAFYSMVISSTMISTYNCPQANDDAEKTIRFIGDAFKLDRIYIDDFIDCILNSMMNIGLISDYHAIASTELLDNEDRDNLELYEIKGQALEEISISERMCFSSYDSRIVSDIKEKMKYGYFHHIYNSKMRFWSIQKRSENGELLSTRQLAILYSLGIGCEKNIERAEKLFLRCVFWGDKISAMLLNYLHQINNSAKYEDGLFEKVYKLIQEDSALISDPKELSFRKENELYNLIRLVKNTVIISRSRYCVNIELVDYLADKRIPYHEKVAFVLNFSEKEWRKNLFCEEKNIIGFRG